MTSTEFEVLFKLRLKLKKGLSNMSRWLASPKGGDVVLAFDNDVIVGWALLHEQYGEKILDVFVHEAYRRRGIGSALAKTLSPKASRASFVGPHDEISHKFWMTLVKFFRPASLAW